MGRSFLYFHGWTVSACIHDGRGGKKMPFMCTIPISFSSTLRAPPEEERKKRGKKMPWAEQH